MMACGQLRRIHGSIARYSIHMAPPHNSALEIVRIRYPKVWKSGDEMRAAQPESDFQNEHDRCEAECSFAVAAAMTIIAAGQKRTPGQDGSQQKHTDHLARPIFLLVSGMIGDHPPRLIPVADHCEKYGLAVPRGGFDSQRTRRPRPDSGPCRARVGHRQRIPFRLRWLQFRYVDCGGGEQGTPIRAATVGGEVVSFCGGIACR